MDKWLEKHKTFQTETYGTDFDAFKTDFAARTAFTTWNMHAAMIELGEATDETPWKPWATYDHGEVWEKNRKNFITENVDALFFIANGLVAAQVTDEELQAAYDAKTSVNIKRQVDGYDASSTKCPGCKRELDKKDAYVTLSEGDPYVRPDALVYALQCRACDHTFDYTVPNGSELP